MVASLKKQFLLLGMICIFSISQLYALKFIAYGDSRSSSTVNTTEAGQMNSQAPELVLHVGDLWSDISQSTWGNIIKGQTNLNALLNANKFLVAYGNHETLSEVKGFSPSLLRGGVGQYSFTEGNCFFVCLGYDPAYNYTWLETQLSSAASTAAKWRFVWQHKPIYSSFSGHGANGITSEGSSVTQYRTLCDKYKVTASFSGHDHGYERTKLMYNNAAVSSATTFDISTTPGTVYFMCGGGGAPFYSKGSAAWVAYNAAVYHIIVVTTTDTTCSFSSINNSGTIFDQCKITQKGVSIENNKLVTHLPTPELSYSDSKLLYTVPGDISGKQNHVSLKLYSMKGELLLTLVDRQMSSGNYSLPLRQGSGIYVCEIIVNNIKNRLKLVVK